MLIIKKFFRIKTNIAIVIFLWHLCFSVIYYFYSLSRYIDANAYYNISLNDNIEFGELGTHFIYYFNSFFSKNIGLSYFVCYMVYNLIGTIGVFALLSSILNSYKFSMSNKNKIWIYIFIFLPSLNLWSALLGKDAFSFLAICLSIYSFTNSINYFLFFLSVIIMLLVRPYIALAMFLSFVISMIFSSRYKLHTKIFLGIICLYLCSVFIYFVANFVGIEAINFYSLKNYIYSRKLLYSDSNAFIDITTMPLLLQLFTYAFRPLPFEAHNFFALFASLDNVLLLILFIKGIVNFLRKQKSVMLKNNLYLWSYVVIVWSTLAVTTSNLGLANRQKWMFLPALYYLIFTIIFSKDIVTTKFILKKIPTT